MKDFFDSDEDAGQQQGRGPQARELSDSAQKLLDGLGDDVCPVQTSARYPHIMNRIALLWDSPKLAERYFDELLIDDRGGRQGFPLNVLSELFTLKQHYLTKVYPKPASKWDQVFISKDRS